MAKFCPVKLSCGNFWKLLKKTAEPPASLPLLPSSLCGLERECDSWRIVPEQEMRAMSQERWSGKQENISDPENSTEQGSHRALGTLLPNF